MAVSTRPQLIDYCLRRLGAPVTEINVDDEQISDRIDDAIEYFQEYHFDGVEKVFLKKKLTQEDINNEYLDLSADNAIISVLRVLPIPNFNAFQTGFFNEEYQLRLNDLENMQSSAIINWAMSQTNFSLIEHLFSIQPTMLFNRKQDKVYLETDWANKFSVDTILIVEAYRALDPSTYPQVYNEADAYCLSQKKRLPTEVEWEKAARGSDERLFVWGDQFNQVNANFGNQVRSIGSLSSDTSVYGVSDLNGNVSEWTASWYNSYKNSEFKEIGRAHV